MHIFYKNSILKLARQDSLSELLCITNLSKFQQFSKAASIDNVCATTKQHYQNISSSLLINFTLTMHSLKILKPSNLPFFFIIHSPFRSL